MVITTKIVYLFIVFRVITLKTIPKYKVFRVTTIKAFIDIYFQSKQTASLQNRLKHLSNLFFCISKNH